MLRRRHMNRKLKLEKRLSSYWRLELGNVILVPAAMIILAYMSENSVGWLSVLAMIPMCGLLAVGGLYWRGKHMRLKGNKYALGQALTLAHKAQYPLLILTALACVLTAAAFGASGLARSTGDLIISTVAAVLAVLEYINYYHRQIQHFDHIADFKRLMTGRGFRRSQMSQDLRAWREQNRAATPK